MMIDALFRFLPAKMQFKIRSSILGQVIIVAKSYQLSLKSQKYYSQNGEDRILEKYLKEKKGFYLDIGSGDPVRGSNTFFLYKKGWSGILIDPLTRNIFSSKILRRRDKIIQGIVGVANEKSPFFEMYPYEYSTTNIDIVNDLVARRKGRLERKIILDSFSVSELNLSINLDQPSLLSVDCEGLDLEVLKTIDLKISNFRVVCVEDFDFNPVSKLSAIDQYLNENGYEIVDRMGLSSIYVKSLWLRENLI